MVRNPSYLGLSTLTHSFESSSMKFIDKVFKGQLVCWQLLMNDSVKDVSGEQKVNISFEDSTLDEVLSTSSE